MTTEGEAKSERVVTLGHSPDPDDAFMFYALAQGRVDTRGLRFVHLLESIESLNRRALKGELDVTAISLHAYPYLSKLYALLPCGASIGEGYGPLVVAREPLSPADLAGLSIAVPGTLTTAFLVLRLMLGQFSHKVVPFDRIGEAVRRGEAGVGLLIHEGQLTYEGEGLHKVVDLGEWWLGETGLPLPLGANAVRKELGPALISRISSIVADSIRYALEHREEAVDYALGFARGMDRSLAERFVGMYVNDYTLDYGPRGREAVAALLGRGHAAGLLPPVPELEFAS